jgi:tetratricopeptide (TPR) repeat protein
MKIYVLLLAWLLHPVIAFPQVTVHDAEVMQIKGKWMQDATLNGHGDPALLYTQFPTLLKQSDAISAMLREAYPFPVGLEATYYYHINGTPICKGAPAPYMVSSFYKSYYYNIHLNKILLGGETGTWVQIFVNSFGRAIQTSGDWMIDGNMTTVYVPWATDGEWKGYPMYTLINGVPGGKNTFYHKSILIARNGRLPFVPLTQKQYLLAIKYKLSKEKGNIYTPDQAEKDFQKTLESIRNNKAFPADKKAQVMADMQRTHNQQMHDAVKGNIAITSAYDNKIKLIDDYLSSHSEAQLQEPAVTSNSILWDFRGYFGPEKNQPAVTPVRLDPSYFSSKLPHYAAQFIMMQWDVERETPKMEFGRQLEAGFPIAKLRQMIDGAGDKNWADESRIKGPDMAAIRKTAEQYADSVLKKKIPVFTSPFTSPLAAVSSNDTSSGFKIPPRNTAALGAIPTQTMEAPELKAFIEQKEKNYTAILQSQATPLPNVDTMNAMATSYAATLYLLDGDSYQAAWCAFKAIEKNPEDVVVLNNAGGILNACGFQPAAVPVLQTALKKLPGNATIQNNLGQSYLALGDADKAASYLQQALGSSPYHPHANFAMACIQYAKGNNGSANSYVQRSLQGAYTDGAMHLFYKLNPGGRLLKILKDQYKPPDYFNEDKYHLPPQCEALGDVQRLQAEYHGYREMVEKVMKQFQDIRKSENELGVKSMMEQIKDYAHSTLRYSPFNELAAMMVKEITLRLADEQDRLGRAQTMYKKEMADLRKEYDHAISQVDNCESKVPFANAYMQAMAAFTIEYQKTWLPVYREYFDDLALWGRLEFPDKHLQRAAYAAAVSGYLAELLRLAETHFLNPCAPDNDGKKEEDPYEFKEPDCGIDIGFSFGVGSFSIDCNKMEFHFGGGLVADVVHTYKTHSTTIAIGLGLDGKFGGTKLKAGPIQGGFSATGKMQYFLTFDGVRPADQGFIWEASVKYKQTLSTGLESGIKKIDQVTTNSLDLSARTVFSFNNGFDSKGSLYDHIDKVMGVQKETQVNKNVKIYNH